MSRKKTVHLFFFLILAHSLAAQGGIVVKTTVDRNKILIGEPIQYTIEADIPQDAAIAFVQIDSIDHFEFLEKPVIDTINTNTGTIIKGRYHLTSFDSGHWVIPSYTLIGTIVTDSIPVDVGYTAANPDQDYHDIKDIIEAQPVKAKPTWWYYAAGGALVVLIILIYLLTRKKAKPVATVEVSVDAYQEAMKQLEQLRAEKGDPRQYYSRLVDIFRLYVNRRKGIHSMQKTTDDLVLQLKELLIPKERFDRLSQALRQADFVKFAKYMPTASDDKTALDDIKNAIQDIEQLP